MEVVDPPDPDPPHGGGDDAAEPQQPLVPHLPAPILAIVLDHLPFDDVRKAIQAAKIFATNVASQVKTLNIMRTRELGYGNYRLITRFRNAICVKILCLVQVEYIYVYKNPRLLWVNGDSVGLILPFIGHFTHTIKTVYLGGFDRNEGFVPYDSDNSFSKSRDSRLFQSLMIGKCSFEHAYIRGWIPQNLKVVGLPHGCRSFSLSVTRINCMFCKRICLSFPTRFIQDGLFTVDYGFCLDRKTFCNITRERFGDRNIQLEGMCFIFDQMKIADFVDSEAQDSFCSRLSLSIDPKELDMVYIGFFDDDQFDNIERLVRDGFDPSQLKFYEVLFMMRPQYANSKCSTLDLYAEYRESYVSDPTFFNLLLKSSFDRLVSLGFPLLANSDLIVADDDDPLISAAIGRYNRPRR